MLVVSIDLSMTCPAICVHDGDTFSFDNCVFYYLTNKVRRLVTTEPFFGRLHHPHKNNEERFDDIASWGARAIPKNAHSVFIEGYSYGSSGNVFEIGENTGVFKNKLYLTLGVVTVPVPPTAVKKFASGSGNATKHKMYNAFVDQTGKDIHPLFKTEGLKDFSPVSDIVDAFFICKWGCAELGIV